MTVLTTNELAERLGITPSGVRDLVADGRIRPVQRGTRPLRFHEHDVAILERDRMPRCERERLRRLAEHWQELTGGRS